MAKTDTVSRVNIKDIFERGILSRNPVLVYAIGICPLIAVAKSAATAAALAILSAAVLVVTETLAALIYKRIPKWLRVGVYAVTGILVLIPFYLLLNKYLPSVGISLGIYIPLLAVNTLIVQRCEAYGVKKKARYAFLDAIANSIGYAIALLATGIIREALGSGKIFGYHLDLLPEAKGFLMPFCGFIILGFVAAFINLIRSKYKIGNEFDAKNSDFIVRTQRRAEKAEKKAEEEKAAAETALEDNKRAALEARAVTKNIENSNDDLSENGEKDAVIENVITEESVEEEAAVSPEETEETPEEKQEGEE